MHTFITEDNHESKKLKDNKNIADHELKYKNVCSIDHYET